ncbi:MAG: hypothetical protein NW241_12515 [Bacteroidia bacterium]|nr:hypothetical protein [Bacteroidia bacterium]
MIPSSGAAGLLARLRRHPFLVRLLHWEYWPASLANVPVYLYWLYFSLRSRHLFFFTAANPAIETGGMFGESKIRILDQIPDAYKPLTVFVPAGSSPEQALRLMKEAGIAFPAIAKPNIGERGLAVEKLDSESALRQYLRRFQADLILQAYVDDPEEYSVLYWRLPGSGRGAISSLCRKIYLGLAGDGRSTLRELILAYPRARFQLAALERRMPERMQEVPAAGEQVTLLPIGNHARGAMFLDARPEIDEALLRTFDAVSSQLQGIYCCRFDLKCPSLADLKAGRNIKILEINGVAGEPAHIYDPAYGGLRAYRDLYAHWKTICTVSTALRRTGVRPLPAREAFRQYRQYRAHVRRVQQALSS